MSRFCFRIPDSNLNLEHEDRLFQSSPNITLIFASKLLRVYSNSLQITFTMKLKVRKSYKIKKQQ